MLTIKKVIIVFQQLLDTINLREKVERSGVYGYNKSISSKSVWAEKKVRDKANSIYSLGNTKANVDAYLRDKPIRDKILSNNITKTIHQGRQGKHILGHNNYIDGRSYIIISTDEVQELINKYAGTGALERSRSGAWRNREIISLDKYIGVNINNETGELKYTDKFYIHYSKKGTHIVPTLKGE